MLSNKFKRQLKQAVSICSAVALVVCSVPGQAKTRAPKVTQIKLTSPLTDTAKRVSATLTMKKGSRFRIKTRLFPSSAKKAVLTYKSSKSKVATVSKKGVIKAKKVGKAKITVSPKKNKKVRAVIQLTVKKSIKKAKKVTLDQNALTLSLENGKNSATLVAKITSPKKPTNKKVRWISEDTSIASVNKSGLVTAKKAGSTSVMAVAADGQGAKAACRVTVEEPGNPGTTGNPVPTASTIPGASQSGSPSAQTSASPGTTTNAPSQSSSPSQIPSASPSSSPAAVDSIKIAIPDDRTGIKQGESLQLAAKNPTSGESVSDITWSSASMTGVSINESGLLSVTKEASTTLSSPKKISVTATLKSNPEITDTVSLSIIENNSVLQDNHIKLNEETAENPQGFSYRSADDGTKAYSTVVDPMRGSVTKVDASIGFQNDMVAWLTIDPTYAGKTVHISAYIKYDKLESLDTIGLIINERFTQQYTNPVVKWNAAPDTWHYISGTYELPEYRDFRYDGTRNNLYLCRFSELPKDEHPVYYLDNVVFSIEKADIEKVTLSAEEDTETIYQNHERQYSAEVTGTNKPIQKVKYEIEPAVENVSISADGLLKVGNAAANSKINIKASSLEDPEKYDTRTITVLKQTIDSLDISVKDNVTEIYQGNELQFTAEVSSTGEPDESVKWSVSPEVAGVSISEDGLLTVGEKVDGETTLCITATSVFDSSKKKDYNITVKENAVKGVTVSSIGDEDTVSPGGTKDLYVTLDVIGTPSKDVTWSIYPEVQGASLSAKGDRCTLSVTEDISPDTEITIKAVSVFDSSKSGQKTITVANTSSEDAGKVIYYENFSTTNSLDLLTQGGVVSFQATKPDDPIWNNFKIFNTFPSNGIIDSGTALNSRCLQSFFGSESDYLQFIVNNEDKREKAFTLSFMFSFYMVPGDDDYMWDESTLPINYNLPLKLVAIDETGAETMLKNNIKIPFPCAFYYTNPEFYEIQGTVNVPAGKKITVQLKLDGDLPDCLIPDDHNATGKPHPVVYNVDNISISTSENKINLNTTDTNTHQLQLSTAPTDQVTYYTKSSLAKSTHEKNATSCSNLALVADVSDTGLITARSAGITTLIAEIKHSDNSTEQKQFTIQVD